MALMIGRGKSLKLNPDLESLYKGRAIICAVDFGVRLHEALQDIDYKKKRLEEKRILQCHYAISGCFFFYVADIQIQVFILRYGSVHTLTPLELDFPHFAIYFQGGLDSLVFSKTPEDSWISNKVSL